jgi:peptidoglycan/xylan/chitin deacetylase (PgdA/CDA1 family)
LADRGYVGLTLSELVSGHAAGTLPPRALAITFDDGYRSALDAKRILDRHGFPATVFVVTDFVDSGRRLTWPGIAQWHDGPYGDELESLRWDDLEQLAASGWEVGSHTRTHPYAPRLSPDELEDEIAGSRELLRRRLGRADTFAYPYGATTPDAQRVVESSGYTAACIGPTGDRDLDDPFAIARVGLYGRDTGLRLRAKLSPRLYTAALRLRADVDDEPLPATPSAASFAAAGHDSA